MTCSIDWNSLELCDYENHYLRLYRSNLLQSPEYARASATINHQKIRFGIIKIDNVDAGFVIILEAGHPKFLHALILDRGPQWYAGFGTPDHIKAFFEVFNRQFPRRPLRRRRIVPEIANDTPQSMVLDAMHLPRRHGEGYQTIWLDLRPEEDILYQNLTSSWQKSLKKAEKYGLTVEWDIHGQHFPWFLKGYQIDKTAKNYPGPSIKMLKALSQHFQPKENMIIGRAILDNQAVAAILLLCHGQSATYQIGWALDQGRQSCANHFLLWKSLTLLKEKGVYDLDLGGVNDATAAGVKKFKQGLGGELTTLVGHYA